MKKSHIISAGDINSLLNLLVFHSFVASSRITFLKKSFRSTIRVPNDFITSQSLLKISFVTYLESGNKNRGDQNI